MPRAIADASPLIHLAKLDHLQLLPVLHDTIIIPPAVWNEVVVHGEGEPGAETVREAREDGWIEVEAPTNEDLLCLLERDLGQGEAQTIALAVASEDPLVLLDERDAREIAGIYDLQKTGTIGILLRAARENHLDDVAATLGRLRDEAGFWISDALIETAIETSTDPPTEG